MARIYAKCGDGFEFSDQIKDLLKAHYKDEKALKGINKIAETAADLYSEYEAKKARVSLSSFDKLIEQIKEVFGMETIDSKFVESASAALNTNTKEVLGKHTAAAKEQADKGSAVAR